IRHRPSVRQLYTQDLVECCVLSEKEAQRIADGFRGKLEKAFESAKQGGRGEIQTAFEDVWQGLDRPYSHQSAETRVAQEQLLQLARALTTVPDGFQLNPKIKRSLPQRLEAVQKQGSIDWAYAELLAMGSLLLEGFPVRLSGQDSARGTFSQRHAVWQDMESEQPYVPLRSLLKNGQATFCLYNSMLSEAAVLGFDYGYSLAEPHMLVIWEAQFGDFANGAQVIIDQFITTSQSKWQRTSGLVMLLPHGYEGQGPEHSNAYLDRYLAACAEDNIQVCNLTTPANYFHALRRQLKRPFRRPLIVMAPKSLLRHKRCLSPVEDLSTGRFEEVLDDPDAPQGAQRLVLCSGKVFYDLLERREELGRRDVALLRIEQFYPFPLQLLRSLAGRYGQAREVVWVQEEPRNRGGWAFMHSRLQGLFPGHPLRCIARKASASSATGSLAVHKKEQEALVSAVFEMAADARSAAPQGKLMAAEELV
ncbi:MAG: 2-oxoglutarate dehydrogenase E1 component, partial [Acidobacteriota bacterium]